MSTCLICLGTSPADAGNSPHHRACLQRLFGTPSLPTIDLDLQHLPARITPEVGKMSISGMQRKALMCLSKDRSALVVASKRSRYILKPQIERYTHVPENEHVSMCIAALAGVEVPRFGLFHLTDGSLAYVVKRYDRTPRKKHHQIDFCQLAGRPAHEKDKGSAEECMALVAGAVTAPEAEMRRLFRLLLVAYWIGNGDLHMKNLSLLRGDDGNYRLSPAYDLVCTWIYGDTSMTLRMGGKDRDLRRRHWLDLAEGHARISRERAEAMIDGLLALAADALSLLERSRLPKALRRDYAVLLRKRSRALS